MRWQGQEINNHAERVVCMSEGMGIKDRGCQIGKILRTGGGRSRSDSLLSSCYFRLGTPLLFLQ